MIDLLLEKYLNSYKQHSWGEKEMFDVFVNPTRRELRELGQSFRFIIDLEKGNLYAFPDNFLHQDAWNKFISEDIKDSRKMYRTPTLFGGVVWKGQVSNEGLQDGLYRNEILEYWVNNMDKFNQFQKYVDIKNWFDRWGDYLRDEVM